MGDGSYALDSAELDTIIKELTACRAHLVERVNDLRLQVRRLHDTWDGLSAEAHLVAQAEIDQGLADMNAALAVFTRAQENARDGYQLVWDANVTMWTAVS